MKEICKHGVYRCMECAEEMEVMLQSARAKVDASIRSTMSDVTERLLANFAE